MISIVIPIFQSKETIERCIFSITEQTYKELEIILIDDGSTDGSGVICDELASHDNRIKVIHKKNGGVSSARNIGIKNATGKYLLFVDSDDTVDKYCCEKCIDVFDKTKADLIIFGYSIIKNRVHASVLPNSDGIYSISSFKNQFDDLYRHFLLNSPCNKMYIRDSVKFNFDENFSLGEDLLFNLKLFTKISKIGIINETLYTYYADTTNSLTKIRKDNFISDCTERYLIGCKLIDEAFGEDFKSLSFKNIYLNDCLTYLNNQVGKETYKNTLPILKQVLNNKTLILELKTTNFTRLSRKIVKLMIVNKQGKLLYYFYRYKAVVTRKTKPKN